ncbi:MAG TPA: cation diffusion facilitator family transporter [Actinomycetota bacterium]|jgi:cation diffusion facilitator family transporter|nr:cation diffusion facilitator family transporter [Actinomycetota bacterium]
MAGVHEHHGHGHEEGAGWLDRLRRPFGHGHSHDPAQGTDAQLEASGRGQRALLVSVLGLGATAVLQALVVWLSGSVALLGDTLHNLADALTAVPLAVAFRLGRRPATRRYTYGYGRAEDLAGIAIVGFIAASAALAAYEAVRRLRDPVEVRHLGVVAGAALIGFAGNELVARYRIAVGRQIGSAALVADGLHARSDGFASLAVLLGVAGVALGLPLADPIVGLAITGTILVVGWDAARQVYRRLMDAVDPSLVERVEQVLRSTPGVLDIGELRLRWIGHRLRTECAVVVDHHLTVVEGHRIAEEAEHRLLHEVPRLTAALVHADPFPHPGADYHELTGPHGEPSG